MSLNKVFRTNRKVRTVGAESQKKEVYFAAIAPSSGSLRLLFAAQWEFLYDQVNSQKEQIPHPEHCYPVFNLHLAFYVISGLLAGQIDPASGQKIPGEQDAIPVNVRGKVRLQIDPQMELFIKGMLQG